MFLGGSRIAEIRSREFFVLLPELYCIKHSIGFVLHITACKPVP